MKEKGTIKFISSYILTFIYNYSIVMLGWFVDLDISSAVLKKLIDVEVQPELVANAVIDKNVDIHLIHKYFTDDAWLLVMDVIEQKHNIPMYVCKFCSHDLHKLPSILCDHCLNWFHIQSVGLKQNPKTRYWFC